MRDKNVQFYIGRLLTACFLFCVMAILTPSAFAEEISGECGVNANWTYSAGTLTITGYGELVDYSSETPAPWYEFGDKIIHLNIADGITNIGDYAFHGCSSLLTLDLPDSVTSIGEKAFYECSSMKLVNWSSGLKIIGRSAFERCWSIQNLYLPDGLVFIDDQAFWRCHGLRSATVPDSVTYFGEAVFAYCDALLHADLQINSQLVSKWTFYGCSSLTTVNLPATVTDIDDNAFEGCEKLSLVRYQGSKDNLEKIGDKIHSDVEGFDPADVVNSQSDVSSSSTFWEDEGVAHLQTNTLSQNNGNIIEVSKTSTGFTSENDSKTEFVETEMEIVIYSELQNEDGWKDIINEVNNLLSSNNIMYDKNANLVQLNVNLFNEMGIEGAYLQELAGKKVVLTVTNVAGSSWTVACDQMNAEEIQEYYDFYYSLSETDIQEPEANQWYALKFHDEIEIDSEVMIMLPEKPTRKNVSLYQKNRNSMVHIQTTKVDDDGYAHFYLAAVDGDTEYFVGIEVAEQIDTEPIIPQNMTKEFDITDTLAPMDYVITGRQSSWGMNIGQVTWIMIGVLGGSVVVIGVVLYLMNKRKLKKGYVVDLDEYELN